MTQQRNAKTLRLGSKDLEMSVGKAAEAAPERGLCHRRISREGRSS
jgi:hypothetical protein